MVSDKGDIILLLKIFRRGGHIVQQRLRHMPCMPLTSSLQVSGTAHMVP